MGVRQPSPPSVVHLIHWWPARPCLHHTLVYDSICYPLVLYTGEQLVPSTSHLILLEEVLPRPTLLTSIPTVPPYVSKSQEPFPDS